MKKTEENLEKYKAQLKARGYENLIPMINPPKDINVLMQRLVIEGNLLLKIEEVSKKSVPNSPSPTQSLENALALCDKNPYVRARAQVLKDLDTERRKEIEMLERTGRTNCGQYTDFVKMVRILGDRFSDRK